jgi:hypothetical protein
MVLLAAGGACGRAAPAPSADDQRTDGRSAPAATDPSQDTARTGFVDTRAEISPTPAEITGRTFAILHGEIRKVHAATGALPTSLEEILQRDEPDPNLRPQRRWLHDGWATPFRYARTRDSYQLTSAGPDRQFGTADDQVSARP